jgi:divalent metal cation (Fe/Co/Zn/Cd) transporter
VLWRLRLERGGRHAPEAVARAEARALKVVGVSFLALALYVAAESAGKLGRGEGPDPSPLGLALASVSLVLMPLLARANRRVARALGSRALDADASQTALCAYLSLAVVLGLGLNAWLGWWWADPVAALAMTPLMVVEGKRALRGESCCETGTCVSR